MQYTIEIERWKREVCVITVESDTPEKAEDIGLNLYLDRNLEGNFQDYGSDMDVKDEEIAVIDDHGNQVLNSPFDSQRNCFK